MDEGKRPKRGRRSFSDEFKAGAVRLVLDEGKTVCGVARDLDLTASALRAWVERARADRSNGKTGLTSEERVELAKLRKQVRELQMEREILGKRWPSSQESIAEVRVHRCVEGALPDPDPLPRAARFPSWLLRLAPAATLDAPQNDVRLRRICAAHERSRRTYGSPRVHAELHAQGISVSRKHVARLMRDERLRARIRKRYRCTTMSDHDQPVAANLLDRRFEAEQPNQRWVGDVTEILTGQGKLYLAVILDLFSRMVVGWALGRQRPPPCAARPRASPAAQVPRSRAAPPHRPGQPVRERGLSARACRPRDRLQHEPARQRSRQRCDGKLVLYDDFRARRPV